MVLGVWRWATRMPPAEQGCIKLTFGGAGATLAEPVDPGRPPHITGSAMLIFAPTREDVLDRLKNDPLTKDGVWDIKNVQIYPPFAPREFLYESVDGDIRNTNVI
ncbi:hypothetical protein N0V92_000469 [Colletotrichum tropicale]|nr:hypothetical protein N0V92_000469 [Colletotrichum tropicale]